MKLLLAFLLSCAVCEAQNFLKEEKTPVEKYLVPIIITERESGLETIDCIYVINLARRPEKWHKMQSLFEQQNLKVNRVNAIDGWLLPLQAQAELAGDYKMNLKPGVIGCLLSHVSVLKDAFERGFDRIWVCEDDLMLVDNVQKLPSLLNRLTQLDPDWDILYTDMGHAAKRSHISLRPDQPGKSWEEYSRRRNLNNNLVTSGLRFGMYSLIVSKKGVAKILRYFTHVYLWSPLDWDIHYIEGIREYSCRHDIVTVNRQCPISDTARPY